MKNSKLINFVFYYFDSIIGPKKFYSIPNEIDEYIQSIISNLMDLPINIGYFEQMQNNIYFYIYTNYIPSDWARGKKEQILFCVFSDIKIDSHQIQPILKRYAEKIEYSENLYKAFYVNSNKLNLDKQRILENYDKLKLILDSCYKECEEAINKELYLKYLIIGLKNAEKVEIIKGIFNFINERLENINKTSLKKYFSVKFKIIKYILDNSIFNIYDLDPKISNSCYSEDYKPDVIIYVLKYYENSFEENKDHFSQLIKHFFGENCIEKLPNQTPILIWIQTNVELTQIKLKEIKEELYKKFELKELNYLNIRIEIIEKEPIKSYIISLIWSFEQIINSI